MNILMLYPKFPEETCKDTGRTAKLLWRRKAGIPPIGLLTVASYLPPDFQVRLIDRNVSEESEADWEWADVVFFSLMMAQQADYSSCVSSAKRHRKPIAVGGPFTHAMPELATAQAAWVCFGEAESIIEEILDDVRADRRGRQYEGSSPPNVELTKPPRFELLQNVNDYAAMAVQFSRGCPFRCEFCDIPEIYGRIPRAKTPAQILAELSSIQQLGFRGHVFFVDDNFIGNKKKAKLALQELASWNREHGYPFRFYTYATINLADDEDLLERMSQAGFFHVFVGIETPDKSVLKATQKMQNVTGDFLERLHRIRQHGIDISAGFVLGFDGEDQEVFETQRSFIQRSGIGIATVSLLQAIPNTDLWRRLKKEGRLLEPKNIPGISTFGGINFIPTGEITRQGYIEGYCNLMKEIYKPKAYFDRVLPGLLSMRKNNEQDVLPYRCRWNVCLVLLWECYHLGIRAKGMRLHFWKTFLNVLWRNPVALEAFAFGCVVFHYMNQRTDFMQQELSQYLSYLPPEDVLNETAHASESSTAGTLRASSEAG
jgi:radical SAM superfamily enzyme YgiQ (UPF0313 family)